MMLNMLKKFGIFAAMVVLALVAWGFLRKVLVPVPVVGALAADVQNMIQNG